MGDNQSVNVVLERIKTAIHNEYDELDLSGLHFDRLPDEIGLAKSLKNLIMYDCGLVELTPAIGGLSNLEGLYLNGNKLSLLPGEVTKLRNLRDLFLNDNKFEIFPKEITSLKSLKRLRFRGNQISEIHQGLGTLINLETFDIRDNNLATLPTQLLKLTNLKYIYLNGNPLPIPPEILEKTNDPQTIISYLQQIKPEHDENWVSERESFLRTFALGLKSTDDSDEFRQMVLERLFYFQIPVPLHESKVIVVGQGAVGKTSIVNCLLSKKFDDSEVKTEGISINRWGIDSLDNSDSEEDNDYQYVVNLLFPVRLNIWDFGGQEIMHATHQFFLTKRSLYLLVLDSRLTQEENRVEYWLKIIQSFSDQSPVLIVGNKIDQHPLDIDRTGLQKKYPNIIGILETSAATGAGIEELKSAISEQVNNLPHVRDLLPETWFTVKNQLEELGREQNFITQDRYLELCAANEVSDEISQRTLIGFLHDLGVVLHFQDDPRLEALGILNPQWVTNGVYKILNSHALFQNKGVLHRSMLDDILNLPEYPANKRLFIVDMMRKFELCYDIEPDKVFLVPDLLPKDEPPLDFEGVPAFEYLYPVLPSSVLTRFIVRMNRHICEGQVWRTGVLLQIHDNRALVKADLEDRTVRIAIDGLEHTRRGILAAILFQLDEIHGSIKGLNPQKRVPVPNAPIAEPLKYEYLLKLERAGQETLLVENGNDLVEVNIRQILSAVEHKIQHEEKGGNVVNIYGNVNTSGGDFSGRDKHISAHDRGVVVGGNFTGNLLTGDENQIFQDSFNKVESATVQPELKETLKSLIEAVATMIKVLPEEKAAEATEDLDKLVDEATKPKPNQKWYSVSIEGLIKAAENLDKLGEPVINLSRKVLSLLTGGAIK